MLIEWLAERSSHEPCEYCQGQRARSRELRLLHTLPPLTSCTVKIPIIRGTERSGRECLRSGRMLWVGSASVSGFWFWLMRRRREPGCLWCALQDWAFHGAWRGDTEGGFGDCCAWYQNHQAHWWICIEIGICELPSEPRLRFWVWRWQHLSRPSVYISNEKLKERSLLVPGIWCRPLWCSDVRFRLLQAIAGIVQCTPTLFLLLSPIKWTLTE